MFGQNDTSQIKEIVTDVGRLTDMKQWERLEKLFVMAPKISTVGEPATKSSRLDFVNDLKAEMKKYFIGTRHKMKTYSSKVSGSKATVHTIIDRSNYVLEGSKRYKWQVSGSYTFELIKKAGEWRIAKFELKPLSQTLVPIAAYA
jgi:SnoaL-like domain